MKYPDNMGQKTTRVEMREFLISEALTASVAGAFGRAGVYVKGAADSKRADFRDDLKEELWELSKQYRNRTPTKTEHINNIIHLANLFSEGEHSRILRNDRFRIGIAQKALNLFLKYRWCMGEIEEPPHCPFDGIVLAKIAKFVEGDPLEPWTKMDDRGEYRRYFETAYAALEHEPEQSLSEWELRIWDER